MDAAAYVLLGGGTFLGAVGFGMFAYASRSSRVEAARQAGEPEEAIQRGLALTRRMRNLCAGVVAIAVLGAVWFSVSN